MQSQIRILVGLFLSFYMLDSYAIKVNVRSSSHEVAGLGFSVNGNRHGGMGSSYTGNNMPAGVYNFGMRVGGVFGNDVACYTNKGTKSVRLINDSTAVLDYDGKRCKVRIVESR